MPAARLTRIDDKPHNDFFEFLSRCLVIYNIFKIKHSLSSDSARHGIPCRRGSLEFQCVSDIFFAFFLLDGVLRFVSHHHEGDKSG